MKRCAGANGCSVGKHFGITAARHGGVRVLSGRHYVGRPDPTRLPKYRLVSTEAVATVRAASEAISRSNRVGTIAYVQNNTEY